MKKRRGRPRSDARKRIDRTLVALLSLAKKKRLSSGRTREMLRVKIARSIRTGRASRSLWERSIAEHVGAGGLRSIPCLAQLELFGKAS